MYVYVQSFKRLLNGIFFQSVTLQFLLDEHSQFFCFCKENNSAGRMRGVDGTVSAWTLWTLTFILRCDQRSIACSKQLGELTGHIWPIWQVVLLDGLLLFETIVRTSRLLPRQKCSLSWKQVPLWFESAAFVAYVWLHCGYQPDKQRRCELLKGPWGSRVHHYPFAKVSIWVVVANAGLEASYLSKHQSQLL